MPEIWWKSRARRTSVAVDEVTPLPVYFPTDLGHVLPSVSGRTTYVQRVIPGIGTGAAYADGEALGTLITFPNVFRANKFSGLLHTALYFDVDDEGLQVDLHLFSRAVTSGTDNSAYAPSDADVLAYLGTVSFTSFSNLGSNQVSVVSNAGIALVSDSAAIYGQAVARGALNIAAENLPRLGLIVLPD